MTRYVSIGHRLTGWNAVKSRVEQLGLNLNDEQVKAITNQIKLLADVKPMGIEEVDVLLAHFHSEVINKGVEGQKREGVLEAAAKAAGMIEEKRRSSMDVEGNWA